MNQIHTSYEVSKRLTEFLGEGAVEPINDDYWLNGHIVNYASWTYKDNVCPAKAKMLPPAYQLHDLLSKPFCEAFNRKFVCESNIEKANPLLMSNIAHAYYYGGMEAVEKALTEMMEGK